MSKKKALERIEQDQDHNPSNYRWYHAPNTDAKKVHRQILSWRKRNKKLRIKEEKRLAKQQAKEAARNPLPLIKNIFYSE